MTDHFDDMMKNRLNDFSSEVPRDMFDQVRKRLEHSDELFDNEISKKMQGYQAPVPANMWDRIQKAKDRRRPVAWWWAAAVLLFIGAGSIVYIKNQKHRQTNVPGQHTERPSGVTNTTSLPTETENEKIAGTEHAVNTIEHPAAAADSSDTTATKYVSPESSFDTHGPTKADNADLNHAKNAGHDYPGKVVSLPRSRKSSVSMTIAAGSVRKAASGEPARAVTTGEDGEDMDESGTLTGSSFNILERKTAGDRLISLKQLIRLSLKTNKLSPSQLLHAELKTPILPCPTTGDKMRNDWYIDLYASPVVIFKNLSGGGLGKNTVTGMDSTLHKQVSFNAGVNLVKSIGEHFLLKAGIQYNQVNEVFRNTRINEIKLITTVTIRTVILSPGDTVYIRDTSVIRQVGTISKQTQNHYKSWDIPLTLGYEFGGSDLRLNANLGLIANVHSSYRGELPDSLQQTVNIANHRSTGVYKTNIGLGLYAGMAILKGIGTNMDLIIEPHARFNLGNMTNDPTWFRQKNILAGVSIGVRYKLKSSRQR